MSGRLGFLQHLKDRGFKAASLIIGDVCRGLVKAANELYPDAQWQCCVVHFLQNVFSHVPNSKTAEFARMLMAIHAREGRSAANTKARELVARLPAMTLPRGAELLETMSRETLAYYAFATSHWRQPRSNNPLERIIREMRRGTRAVGAFPDGHADYSIPINNLNFWSTQRRLNGARHSARLSGRGVALKEDDIASLD